jgi:hypothetical protein
LEDFIQAEDQQDGSPAPTSASPDVSEVIVPPLIQQHPEKNKSFVPLRLIILVPAKNLYTLKLPGIINNLIHQNKSNLLLLRVIDDSKDDLIFCKRFRGITGSFDNGYMSDIDLIPKDYLCEGECKSMSAISPGVNL